MLSICAATGPLNASWKGARRSGRGGLYGERWGAGPLAEPRPARRSGSGAQTTRWRDAARGFYARGGRPASVDRTGRYTLEELRARPCRYWLLAGESKQADTALHMGLATHLVVDQDLALALLERQGRAIPRGRSRRRADENFIVKAFIDTFQLQR